MDMVMISIFVLNFGISSFATCIIKLPVLCTCVTGAAKAAPRVSRARAETTRVHASAGRLEQAVELEG